MINLIVRESESSLFPHRNQAYSLPDFERLANAAALEARKAGVTHEVTVGIQHEGAAMTVVTPLGKYLGLLDHMADTLNKIGFVGEEVEDLNAAMRISAMWDVFDEARGELH